MTWVVRDKSIQSWTKHVHLYWAFSSFLGCDGTGTLTKDSGTMKSPEYQFGNHPVFLCQWLINAPQEYNINLTLTYKTGSLGSMPCSNHFVELFNGSFPANATLGRFCRNTNSRTILIKGASTYVMLWIDTDVDVKERPTFSAHYKFVLKSKRGNADKLWIQFAFKCCFHQWTESFDIFR